MGLQVRLYFARFLLWRERILQIVNQCTHDRSGIGNCTKNDDFMDGCSFVTPNTFYPYSGLCSIAASQPYFDVNCANSGQGFLSCKGSSWGPLASKCFDSTLFRHSSDGSSYAAFDTYVLVGCYRTRCAQNNVSNYTLEIQDPLNTWRLCQPNLQLFVEGYHGYITCPPEFDSVCAMSSPYTPEMSPQPTTLAPPIITTFNSVVSMVVSLPISVQDFTDAKQVLSRIPVAKTTEVKTEDQESHQYLNSHQEITLVYICRLILNDI